MFEWESCKHDLQEPSSWKNVLSLRTQERVSQWIQGSSETPSILRHETSSTWDNTWLYIWQQHVPSLAITTQARKNADSTDPSKTVKRWKRKKKCKAWGPCKHHGSSWQSVKYKHAKWIQTNHHTLATDRQHHATEQAKACRHPEDWPQGMNDGNTHCKQVHRSSVWMRPLYLCYTDETRLIK